MVRSGKKEKWIAYTLAVLLCLVLTSFWLMCNVFAKYSAEASGEDGARVAKFEVTEVGNGGTDLTQQLKLDVYPGFKQTYKVGVTNSSEVAITYVMNVENKYGNLPLQFRMLDKDGNAITSESTDGADSSAQDNTFSESADISANDQTEHVYQLEISWPVNTVSGAANNNADLQDSDYAGKVDVIEITLKAVQKD